MYMYLSNKFSELTFKEIYGCQKLRPEGVLSII